MCGPICNCELHVNLGRVFDRVKLAKARPTSSCSADFFKVISTSQCFCLYVHYYNFELCYVIVSGRLNIVSVVLPE